MGSAQLADERLQLGVDLAGVAGGTMRPVCQGRHPAGLVTANPAVHRLAMDVVAVSDFRDRGPLDEDLQHCLVPLFHDGQLHEHQSQLPLADVCREKPS